MTVAETIYLNSIKAALSDFIYSISVLEQRDSTDSIIDKIKCILLNKYVAIMEHYLNDTITGDLNFFTVTEAEDIIQRINSITKSNYWLDLS